MKLLEKLKLFFSRKNPEITHLSQFETPPVYHVDEDGGRIIPIVPTHHTEDAFELADERYFQEKE